MRILHVHSGNLYGGVETMLTTLARQREASPELQQNFALCFEGRLSGELANAGVPPHRMGPVRVSRPLTVLRARHRLKQILASERYDALMFHSAWSYAVFAPVCRAARVPGVIWLHGSAGGRHWSERWAARTRPSLVLSNSRFTCQSADRLYPNTPKHILYCPLELSHTALPVQERETIRAELKTPPASIVIAQVSRMERLKGQFLHVEALGRLKSIPGWTCWIIGGPQREQERVYFEELRNAVLRLGIAERVRFLEERTDVPRLLRAADIYCQPNVGPESFGITFVEALNAGLPVVTTSIGGATEILDETCGMLASPGNVTEIAGMLRRLIENSDLRRKAAERGPARAKELCDPVARMKDLSRILSSTLSSPGGNAS